MIQKFSGKIPIKSHRSSILFQFRVAGGLQPAAEAGYTSWTHRWPVAGLTLDRIKYPETDKNSNQDVAAMETHLFLFNTLHSTLLLHPGQK